MRRWGDRKALEKLFKAVFLGALPLTPLLFVDNAKGFGGDRKATD